MSNSRTSILRRILVGVGASALVGLPPIIVGAAPATPPPKEPPPPAVEPALSEPPEYAPADPSEKSDQAAAAEALAAPTEWVQTSDDSVMDAATWERLQDPAASGLYSGAGFNGFNYHNYGDYEIVLATSSAGNVELLRSHLQAVADQVNAQVGSSIRLRSSTISGPADPTTLSAPDGQIVAMVASTSGCSGTNWAGCGGVRGGASIDGIYHYSAGVLWIHPDALSYSSSDLRHVVEHEVGHSLGLAHYDQMYAGQNQVMHSSSYPTSTGFRIGDLNGIDWLPDTPPSNDSGWSATAVGPNPQTATASTWFATKESGELSHGGDAARRSVWYRYDPVPEQNGQLATIWTSSEPGGFDTQLAVYRGSTHSSGTLVAQNDDFNGMNSSVEFTVDSSSTYWIVVEGYGWARGYTQVNFDLPILRPPNDDFVNAFTLSEGTSYGTNSHGTQEPSEPANGWSGVHGIWWTITLGAPTQVTVDTLGTSFDTTLEVFQAGQTPSAASPGTLVVSNDDNPAAPDNTSSVTFIAEANVTYFVRFDGWHGNQGDMVLNVGFDVASAYAPVSPTRVFDSRYGTGQVWDPLVGSYTQSTPLNGGQSYSIRVAGSGTPIPADAVAVVANITTTRQQYGGYLSAFPAGTDDPGTSILNWSKQSSTANQAIIKIGVNSNSSPGYIDIVPSSGPTDVIIDVLGYFSDTASYLQEAVTPARIMDTRDGTGTWQAPFSGNAERTLLVAGQGNVPANATAAILNVTVARPNANGFVAVYPNGQAPPATSTLNWPAGRSVANHAIAPLGADGRLRIKTTTTGTVEVIVDVVGWFGPTGSNRFMAVDPIRLLDTRSGVGSYGTFSPGQMRTLAGAGVFSQQVGISALAMNLTATQPSTASWATAWAADNSVQPATSNLNWIAGETRANLSTTPTDATGRYKLKNALGTVHLIADATGAYLPTNW